METTNPQSRKGLMELAQRCLAQLDREETHLEDTRKVLGTAYAAAVSGQSQGMAQALERQAEAVAAMRREREAFRQEAGAWLNLPVHEVTLQKLARHLPSDIAQRLLQRRAQLRARCTEVQRLVGELALLSHYVLDFLKRFFIELTGGVKCGRYGPEGLRQEPVYGSLLRAQG
jgi:hypothetical protein